MVGVASSTVLAQDPTRIDPKHFKVELENDEVRVVRITMGPHEQSPLDEHQAGVTVYLTDVNVKHTYPNGKTDEGHRKAGETRWGAPVKHASENLSDKPFKEISVELKAKPAAAKPPGAR